MARKVSDVLNEWNYNPTRNRECTPQKRQLAEDAVSLMHFTRAQFPSGEQAFYHVQFYWSNHFYRIAVQQAHGSWWTRINDKELDCGGYDTRIDAVQAIVRMMVSDAIAEYAEGRSKGIQRLQAAAERTADHREVVCSSEEKKNPTTTTTTKGQTTMALRRWEKRVWLERAIADQLKWIADHGESLPGYVAHYGSADDANHYGNGGEAIYAADMGELKRLTSELKKLKR